MNIFNNIPTQMTKQPLQKTTNWIVALLIFVLPFFFLPITPEFFDFNKQALLLIDVLVLLVIWTIQSYASKQFSFRTSRLTLPLMLFWGAAVLSILFASINRVESLITPLGVGTITAATLLYFIVTSLLDEKGTRLVKTALIVSGALLAVATTYQYVGLGEILASAEYLKSRSFTPTGALLTTVAYLIAILPLAISHLRTALQQKNHIISVSTGLVSIALLIGIGITGYQLVTTTQPLTMPHTVGWNIAAEVFKNKPFFGIGTENFLTAFVQGRPARLNSSDLWNIRFIVSSNVYFHFFTTLGVIGLITFLFVITRATLLLKEKTKTETWYSIILLALLFAFLPPAFLTLVLFYILAALTDSGEMRSIRLPQTQLLGIIALVPILFIVGVGYAFGRVYAGEFTFKKSIDALNLGQGGDAYNLQISARSLNPYSDRYRRAYAQTNLALAVNFAQTPDPSDQDRNNILQLSQQAIRESRNAIILNRTNVLNWENIARVYRQLINLSTDAEQFALASYREAIALDPTNPLLRIDYGSVFFAAEDFDNAIRQFELAVQLKPDHANAHFNLATAYRSKGENQKAFNEMAATLSLVEPDSNDYTVASTQLEQLRQLLGAAQLEETGSPETLTTPEIAEPQITPPIELSEDEAPPAEDETTTTDSKLPTPTPNV